MLLLRRARVQSLVGGLRSLSSRGVAKRNFFFKFKNKKIKEEVVEIQRGRSQVTRGCPAGGWQSWELHGEDAAAVTGGLHLAQCWARSAKSLTEPS